MSRKELPRAAPQLIVRSVQRLERRVVTGGAPALRHVDRRRPSPQRLADEALRHNSRVHDEHLRRVQRRAREAPRGPTGTRSAGNGCGVPGPRAAGEAHPRGPLATAAGACAKPPAARSRRSAFECGDGLSLPSDSSAVNQERAGSAMRPVIDGDPFTDWGGFRPRGARGDHDSAWGDEPRGDR